MKPHGVCSILREVAPFVTKDHVFVSAAAGISLGNMEKVSCCRATAIYLPDRLVFTKVWCYITVHTELVLDWQRTT